jgi:hypothetical protein
LRWKQFYEKNYTHEQTNIILFTIILRTLKVILSMISTRRLAERGISPPCSAAGRGGTIFLEF